MLLFTMLGITSDYVQIVEHKQFYAFEKRCHVQQRKVANCGGRGLCGTCIVEVWIIMFQTFSI